MGVFENCLVLLELKDLTFKEKKKLKSLMTENGGSISFVVNKKCSLVVTSSVANLSSNRLRCIQKYQTPVVRPDYVHSCVDRGVLLPLDEYRLDASSSSSSSPVHRPQRPDPRDSPVTENKNTDEESRIYSELDLDVPEFPDDFQVAKYAIFEKRNSSSWCVVELQSARTKLGRRYRVVRYWKDNLAAKKAAVKDRMFFLSTSEKALEIYESLTQLDSSSLQRRSSIPLEVQHLGSAPLQQLLLEEKLNTGSVSQEVAVFVEMLWTEALGRLDTVLRVPIDELSLNDVSRAEGLLLQAQKNLKEGNISTASSLLNEVNNLLPHRGPRLLEPNTWVLSQKLDLCQLIRDVLNVSEMSLRSAEPSCVGKYRALRCSIENLPPDSVVFQNIAGLLHGSPVKIHQIMSVSRGAEFQSFKAELGNIKPLLHSSSPSNFVGILSRGLLLPRVGVEHHGIERTDVGNLGSGIYFSDSVRTSLKYSKPSETDGSRLLLVCDVALGWCKDVHKRDPTLNQAPEGHHSVHAVRRAQNPESDFEDDEFVVYSPDQVKIKYVVQFSVEGDQLKDFHPAVDTSAEPGQPDTDQELLSVDDDMENIKNPLEDVTVGLLDSSGQQLPLQAVHMKCKLMDLLSQVIIFQKYTNLSSVSIEAKYVFPLDDSAAVCGFEAFINGKHVVGQVKEKETARREYRQAIEKGHGAYLMDQDAPNVFTISVGNLPPGATVLIKVTFVSELVVRDGSILFSLPGSVAPWQESAALKQTTQVSVQKVCVTDEAANRDFTLDVSVEMPNKISDLRCITHQVKMKRTDCKAVVSVLPGQVMGSDGFQLSVSLSEVHLPRMWVEKHPDKDSQACMLVFYPDFELDSGSEADEVVLVLDTSESMRGELLGLAQRIALQVLKKLQNSTRINVVLFGTDHTEAFLKAQPLSEVRQAAESFIKRCSPAGGGTELWRPLRALGLLPPSRGVRNLLLLSDGHIQNPALTLQLLRDDAPHSRLFTCGLSPTANRHMLRALAQAGGGAYEFFDTKTKHTWAEKVMRQVKRMSSPGCTSVSVKWQQFNPTAPLPVQAPKQLHALFSDYHTLVYGLVPHCTQATLLGNLRGQELETMVSTTELQKTRGTFLHKLTARALIRDYEDGSLETNEAEHEGKKAELKSFIVELSKEFSVLSQFTSFVAIEDRDRQVEDGITDIPKLIAEEDVDFLPYVSWTSPEDPLTRIIERSSSSKELMDCCELLMEVAEYEDVAVGEEEEFCPPFTVLQFAPRASEVKTSLDKSAYANIAYKLKAPGAVPQRSAFAFGAARSAAGPSGSAQALDFTHTRPKFEIHDSDSDPESTVTEELRRPYEHARALRRIHTSSDELLLRKEEKVQSSQIHQHLIMAPSPSPPIVHSENLYRFSAISSESSLYFQSHPSIVLSESSSRSSNRTIPVLPQMPPPPPPGSVFTCPVRDDDVLDIDEQMDAVQRRNISVDMESDMSNTSVESFEVMFCDAPSTEDVRRRRRRHRRRQYYCYDHFAELVDSDPEKLKRKWTKIFHLQHLDGYWELTTHLGQLIRLNVDVFANVFLKNKGICSLGTKAHADILRMMATLLVLQLMRVEKLEEGKLLRNLFHMEESSELRSERWDRVKKAVDWVRWADWQYPCICSRLELGLSWESCTRQLLGFDSLPSFSSLIGLDLLVH